MYQHVSLVPRFLVAQLESGYEANHGLQYRRGSRTVVRIMAAQDKKCMFQVSLTPPRVTLVQLSTVVVNFLQLFQSNVAIPGCNYLQVLGVQFQHFCFTCSTALMDVKTNGVLQSSSTEWLDELAGTSYCHYFQVSQTLCMQAHFLSDYVILQYIFTHSAVPRVT